MDITTVDITTVASDLVVLHDGTRVVRTAGLEPDTEYTIEGITVRTAARPGGGPAGPTAERVEHAGWKNGLAPFKAGRAGRGARPGPHRRQPAGHF